MDVRAKQSSEKRLIDANALREEMYEYVFPIINNNLMGAADAYYRILHLLEDAPTVEVVRCGKCKNFRPYEREEHKGDCAELVGLESCVYEDDFCSYGERKEGAD